MVGQIAINDFSSTPKYLQIVNYIVDGIQFNAIRPGEKLPSLYELCAELNVSKRTVERAYDHLRKQNIIGGVHGKGYYINSLKPGQGLRVLLLFNELSTHKKIVYDAFVDQMGTDWSGDPVALDLFTYNNNYRIFEDLLLKHLGEYSHYVIIPHLDSHQEKTAQLLNQVPKEKLILLDKRVEGLSGQYASVVQNFEKDLIQSLTEALPLLNKYATLNMLLPTDTNRSNAIVNGFFAFCYEYGFQAKPIYEVGNLSIEGSSAYICLREEDLFTVIGKTKDTSYQIGKQVGIIAYNETPLKEILLDGITVISTDFDRMGRTAADLVRANHPRHVENPCRLITRRSL